MDSVNPPSNSMADDAIKRVIEDYLANMIIPAAECCTRIVEGQEKVLIFDRHQYMELYRVINAHRFMEQFIETSMFSVYLVKKYL